MPYRTFFIRIYINVYFTAKLRSKELTVFSISLGFNSMPFHVYSTYFIINIEKFIAGNKSIMFSGHNDMNK